MGIGCVRTCPCRWFARHSQKTIQSAIAVQCTKAKASPDHSQIRFGKCLVFAIPWIWSSSCRSFATLSVWAWEKASHSNASILAICVSSQNARHIDISFTILLVPFHDRSLLHVIVLSILGLVFGALTKCAFGRKLLLNYPKIFSLGFVSHEGPTEEKMKNTKFSITFYGDGWPKEEALSEPTDSHTALPSKQLVTRVSATNPGTSNDNHSSWIVIVHK